MGLGSEVLGGRRGRRHQKASQRQDRNHTTREPPPKGHETDG